MFPINVVLVFPMHVFAPRNYVTRAEKLGCGKAYRSWRAFINIAPGIRGMWVPVKVHTQPEWLGPPL